MKPLYPFNQLLSMIETATDFTLANIYGQFLDDMPLYRPFQRELLDYAIGMRKRIIESEKVEARK